MRGVEDKGGSRRTFAKPLHEYVEQSGFSCSHVARQQHETFSDWLIPVGEGSQSLLHRICNIEEARVGIQS